jgi:Protein of unknown function (DUF3987)
MSRDGVATIVTSATEMRPEPPRPLMRELPPADPYPIDALGDVLAVAARAIHDRVQAPLATCGQSVLAAATLATQAHADIELPTRHVKPLSSYYVTVAATGERKSAVDHEALWPVRRREAVLREAYTTDALAHRNASEAWETARRDARKRGKGDRAAIRAELNALGPAPAAPLKPILTCPEPTYEGMCLLLRDGQPSIGIFAAEGGQFIGGHGMRTDTDARLRTATGLSAAWDGEPIRRVRALDGVTVMPGRRVAMHLMAQPDVAAKWMGDPLLIDQGLMSRVLATAPDPASGTRMWHDPSPDSDAAMRRYGARLLDIFERPMPLAPGAGNELAPRTLPLAGDAQRWWIKFVDHVEARLGAGGELAPIRGLANKLPEHAARIAAVLTLIRDIGAGEIATAEIEAGIAIAQHYAAEAMRLHGASCISGELREAQSLLTWLLATWHEAMVSLPDIYQRGPNSIRDRTRALGAVTILVEHGWLVSAPPCEIDGTWRREVWRIVRG